MVLPVPVAVPTLHVGGGGAMVVGPDMPRLGQGGMEADLAPLFASGATRFGRLASGMEAVQERLRSDAAEFNASDDYCPTLSASFDTVDRGLQ